MGFWIFMLLVAVLCPLILLVFGYVFHSGRPRRINAFWGYRTARSMQDADTWRFAHRFCGTLWIKIGWVLLPLSLVVMFLVRTQSETMQALGSLSLAAGLFAILFSIRQTEAALRRSFLTSGSRKHPS